MSHSILSIKCLNRFVQINFGFNFPRELIQLICILAYDPSNLYASKNQTIFYNRGKTYVCGNGQYSFKEFNIPNIKQISNGHDHSAAITFDGGVFTWGKNNYGQLGHTENPIQIDLHWFDRQDYGYI